MTSKTDAKPTIQIVDIEEKTTANPWAEHAQALNEAGAGKGIVIQVNADEFDKEHLKFQAAARAEGFTARLDDTREDDGFIYATYKWRPATRRKAKGETADETPES